MTKDKAIELLDNLIGMVEDNHGSDYDAAIHMAIDALKAADVVEVVRCKDCKHKPNGYTDDDVLRYPNFPHEENNPCPCQVYEDEWYSWIPNDDFYCSYGERADT